MAYSSPPPPPPGAYNISAAASEAPPKSSRTLLWIIIAIVVIAIIVVVVVVVLRSKKTTTTGTGGTSGTTGTTGTTGTQCSGVSTAQTGFVLFTNQANAGTQTFVQTITGMCVDVCAHTCAGNTGCEGFTYTPSTFTCVLQGRLNYPGPPGNLGFATAVGTNTYAKILPTTDSVTNSTCIDQGCGLSQFSAHYNNCELTGSLANCSPCQQCNTQAAITTCGNPEGTASYWVGTGGDSWRWIPLSTDGFSNGYCIPYASGLS